jgi:SSS family solute:Na+ symporter
LCGALDQYYVRFGRIATVIGVVIAIGTAFIAAGYRLLVGVPRPFRQG